MYSDELIQAYLFAFANGITTMKTIQDARLDGIVYRKDMAKMMVNYAIKVLARIPST